jgi:putative protease
MLRDGEPTEVAAGSGIFVQIPNMAGKEKALIARILPNEPKREAQVEVIS